MVCGKTTELVFALDSRRHRPSEREGMWRWMAGVEV